MLRAGVNVFGSERSGTVKVMIRRNQAGVLSAYIAKKDLEEPIVEMEKPEIWGGLVKLANGWRLMLPAMDALTVLPITVEARRLGEMEI
jgi:nitrogen fixation protein NifT